MTARPSILVFGDINADIIARVKSWPNPGEECLTNKVEFHCGGVAANCAIALARWKVHPTLIAQVGQDAIADTLLQKLPVNGVSTAHIHRTNRAMSGLLYINVTPDGQRTFFGSRGASQTLDLQRRDLPAVKRTQAALLMGYSFLDPIPTRAANQVISAVHKNNGWVALDVGMEPSQKIPRKLLQAAKYVDVLLVSDEEAAALTGTRDIRNSLRTLQQTGASEIVIKLGRRGCLIAKGGTVTQVPAFKVRVVDSTGAGDAFTAAYLQAKLRHWPVEEAGLAGNAAGAATITVVGAGEQTPTLREIEKVLRMQRFGNRWKEVRRRILRRLRRLHQIIPSAGSGASR
jgi:ribokinase